MSAMKRILFASLMTSLTLAFAPLQTPPSHSTVVRFGQLWDGERLIQNAVVVIDGAKITRVGGGNVQVPKGAEEIDLRKYTGIPGMIDLHTHITYYWDPTSGTKPLDRVRRTPDEALAGAAKNGLRTLETGVTTVRDLNGSGGIDYRLRDDVNAGRTIGPRLFVAGQGISAGRGGPNPDAMRQQAEARVKAGSDWVKLYGSRGSFDSVETTQTVTFEEMKAVVEAAHALGHKVAIHSYGASGVKDAVRAGADSVEHGIELDDETLAEMVKRGTVWVPTIDHNQYYIDAKDEYGFPPDAIPPLRDYIQKNLESTTRAFKAGVKIGMGSDAVYSMFGRNTGELAWLVKAGMTPAQALGAATTTPAALLGMTDALGRVAPGFFAVLVAIDGDPLRDIDAAIHGVRWVMKDGAVVVDKRK